MLRTVAIAIVLFVVSVHPANGQYKPEDFQESFVAWRDSVDEFACAMLIELDVKAGDPNVDSFSESWHLHAFSDSAKARRHDVKDNGLIFASGRDERSNTHAVTAVFKKDRVVQKHWTITASAQSNSTDKDDQDKYQKQIFFDPLSLCIIGNAVLKERNLIPTPPDTLTVVFGRAQYERAIQTEKGHELSMLTSPTMSVYDTIVVDKKVGYMPVSVVRSIGKGSKAVVIERINTKWIAHGKTWFPHETNIEQIAGKIRKRWKVAYHWMLGTPKNIFDTEANWVDSLSFRDAVLDGSFNRSN